MNNVAIGFNPPYGVGCMLSVKFIRHAVKSYNANLICMILPHRATVARYDGFKLSYKRIVPKGSFYKHGIKKVFHYYAFWSVFEKGSPSPIEKLGTCIPQRNILGIQRFKPHAMLLKNILLIGRYYTKFKWHWVTDIQFDHIPAHTEYIAIYLEEYVGEKQVNDIVNTVENYRSEVVFYKRSICIQDVVKALV
ncbi:hypothetical protein DFS34DRAFT_590265 [Phlyctochytrium arcticum]|nr:hypothetical protein DFS34DRAFT_590265 [Phlyctochytrium arcticum]